MMLAGMLHPDVTPDFDAGIEVPSAGHVNCATMGAEYGATPSASELMPCYSFQVVQLTKYGEKG